MLKSLYLSIALASAFIVAVPATVNAQFQGPGASNRSNAGTVTTAAEASRARPLTRAVLTGNIVQRQRAGRYTFRDSTGRITVEIPRPVFRNYKVTTQTDVRLTGRVDRGVGGRYVEVLRLEVLR